MRRTRGDAPRAPYSKELIVQIKKLSPRMVRVALTLSALCSVTAASSLLSQQAQVPALAAPAAPAPATTPTPAPRASTLYAQDDANAPTIASAKAANEAAMAGDNHTIVVSTLVLVLAVVILVLLIA